MIATVTREWRFSGQPTKGQVKRIHRWARERERIARRLGLIKRRPRCARQVREWIAAHR